MSVAKSRLVKVFEFLKLLNESRNPVSRQVTPDASPLWLDDWPTHPFIEIQRGDRTEEESEETEAEPEPVIRVRRANLTECPKPPKVLDGWLKPGWQSVDGQVDVL